MTGAPAKPQIAAEITKAASLFRATAIPALAVPCALSRIAGRASRTRVLDSAKIPICEASADTNARLQDIRRTARKRMRTGGGGTDDRIWLVSFMDYDLGYFDDETCRLEPLANPFGPKVLPMSSE